MITSDATAQTSTGGSSAGASGGKHDATTTGALLQGDGDVQVAKGGVMADVSVSGQKFSYKPLAK